MKIAPQVFWKIIIQMQYLRKMLEEKYIFFSEKTETMYLSSIAKMLGEVR